jgi:uncharacterized protein (UPF0333 family)
MKGKGQVSVEFQKRFICAGEKGQVSVEFLIVLALLLVLFLFSMAIFAERNSGFIYSKERHEAGVVAGKLARTINGIHLAGGGAEATVLLEEKGIDFNVSVSGNSVVVEWQGNYVDAALLTDGVSAAQIGFGRFVNVRNVNGGIVIENA